MTASGFATKRQEEVYDFTMEKVVKLLCGKVDELLTELGNHDIDLFFDPRTYGAHKMWCRTMMDTVKTVMRMEKQKH
jgi:hypothetical protein